jgi:hypothetical protein
MWAKNCNNQLMRVRGAPVAGDGRDALQGVPRRRPNRLVDPFANPDASGGDFIRRELRLTQVLKSS